MDKLERIREFVLKQKEDINYRILHSEPKDCAVEFGALWVLERLSEILEENDGGNSQH